MRATPVLLPASLGPGVVGGFSLRVGGASEAPYDSFNLALNVGDDPESVRTNRSALMSAVGVPIQHVGWAEQVHAGTVASGAETFASEHGAPGADALVSATRGVLLCVRVADCVPLLLADAGAGVIGAVHAGRMGLAAGVVSNAVQEMEAAGAVRRNIRAVLGPAICGRCYEVPDEMAAEFDAQIPGSRGVTTSGTPSIDLLRATTVLLAEAGVTGVHDVGECTTEQPDRWFSYRRAQRTGRFVGYVALT